MISLYHGYYIVFYNFNIAQMYKTMHIYFLLENTSKAIIRDAIWILINGDVFNPEMWNECCS